MWESIKTVLASEAVRRALALILLVLADALTLASPKRPRTPKK